MSRDHTDESGPPTKAQETDEDFRPLVHDDRGLKNRPTNETRVVPVPPRLVQKHRVHIEASGTIADGRLFGNERGGVVAPPTCWRVWDSTRLALTPEQAASPLAPRPYDLRHAALSS